VTRLPPIPITPIPVPIGASPLVLFGGSFDPPHLGHIELAQAARNAAQSTTTEPWLVLVPAGRSPFKDRTTPANDRCDMLRAAFAAISNAAVWTDEIDRANIQANTETSTQTAHSASYWVDTLRRAKLARPDASLRFIIGTDQATQFHRWHEPREILALATPIVLPRAPITTGESLMSEIDRHAPGFWTQPELHAWSTWIAPAPLRDVNSTAIRAGLSNSATAAQRAKAESGLSPQVLDIIRSRGLYAKASDGSSSP
jgi:nicotinate-nucleotide adenylyltransferase